MSARVYRGAVLLEFTLAISLLVTLATGIADAGTAFRIKQVLKIAAREGSRVASVTLDLQENDTGVLNVVDEILRDSHVDLDRTTRSVRPGAPATGSPVTVEVTYDYAPMFPLIGLGVGGTIQLRSSTTMRYEPAAAS